MSAADIAALARLAHAHPVRLTLRDERGADHELVIPAGSSAAEVATLLASLDA